MNKEEFLKQLQDSLRGNVNPEVIRENLEFYETYILQEMRKNKTEQEVLQALGNPRILAQTIIDTSQMDSRGHNEKRSEDARAGESYGYGRSDENCGYGGVISGNKAKLLMWEFWLL